MRHFWRPHVALRLLLTVLQVVRGFWIIGLHFPRLEPVERQRHVQRWAAQMLQAMGVELVHQGHSRSQDLSYSSTAGDEVEDLFLLLAYVKVRSWVFHTHSPTKQCPQQMMVLDA